MLGFVPVAAGSLHRAKATTAQAFVSAYEEIHRAYIDRPASEMIMIKSAYEVPLLDSVACAEGFADLHFLQFDNPVSAQKALAYYQQLPTVEIAEADSEVYFCETDTAAYETSSAASASSHLSWGSDMIGVDDYIEQLGDSVNQLPTMTVGIIDSGVDTDHSFLADRIIRTGVNYSDSGTENSEEDDNGHGTHVAGIIADNTTPNVKIRSYKCLNNNGRGSTSSVGAAIIQAMQDGVNVLNLSLGHQDAEGENIHRLLIEDAIQQGITVCISAGNDGIDAAGYHPANVEAAITVGAVNQYEELCGFSNYGSTVDLLAPGKSINSCWLDNKYRSASGTSMAAPFAAAASAMALSVHPDYTCQEVCDFLMRYGRTIGNSKVPRAKLLTVSVTDRERPQAPIFSVMSGNYNDEVRLTMTCPTENTDIYYTVYGYAHYYYGDVQVVLVPETQYDGEIVMEETSFIRAYSKNADGVKGGTATAYYYISYTDNQFEIDENGVITAYHGNQPYLAVPDTVDGITVRGIGDSVFRQSIDTTSTEEDFLVSISLPETCTFIGKYAFMYNGKLKKVIADCLQTIETGAFSRANYLEEINLTDVISLDSYAFMETNITEVYNTHLTALSDWVFHSCDYLKEVYLPNIERIGESVFYSCQHMTAADFPNVTYVGRDAFENCEALTRIYMPQLEELALGGHQFNHCPVTVDSLNIGNYSGALPQYALASTQLQYMDNNNLTELGMFSLYNTPLSFVRLHNVQTIRNSAFSECASLETAYLPSVITIENAVFDKSNLQTVFAPMLQEFDVGSFHTDRQNAATSSGNPVSIYTMGEPTNVKNNSRLSDTTIAAFSYTFYTPSGSSVSRICTEKGWQQIDSDTMVDAIGSHTDESGNTVFEFGWRNIDNIEQYASEIAYYGEGTIVGTTIGRPLEKDGVTYFQVIGEKELCGCVDIDGMIFRSAPLTAGENELEPENDCEHDWQMVYYVSVENDTIVVFHCPNCNEYYRVRFSEHLNRRDFPLLDRNGDGIVNAKDLAYVMKRA